MRFNRDYSDMAAGLNIRWEAQPGFHRAASYHNIIAQA
jgi:hypothetical protein